MRAPYVLPRMFFYLGLVTVAQTALRPADFVTLSDLFFFISLLLALFELTVRRELDVTVPGLFLAGLACIFIGGVISGSLSDAPGSSFISLSKYLYLLSLWFWLSALVIRNVSQVQTAIICWLLSVAVTSIGAILQAGWIDTISHVGPGPGRMTGLTQHVNDLGGAACIATVPALMLASRSANNPGHKTGAIGLLVFILLGLILSVSITGVVAASGSILIWLYMQNDKRQYLYVLMLVAALIFVLVPLVVHYGVVSVIERVGQLVEYGAANITIDTRIETYQAAMSSIFQNPLIGAGIGPDTGATITGYVVHNLLLASLYEGGLLFFAGQLLILFVIAYQAIKLINNLAVEKEIIFAKALLASYMAFLILGLAQPIYYNRFEWVGAALIFTLNTISERRRHARQMIAYLHMEELKPDL